MATRLVPRAPRTISTSPPAPPPTSAPTHRPSTVQYPLPVARRCCDRSPCAAGPLARRRCAEPRPQLLIYEHVHCATEARAKAEAKLASACLHGGYTKLGYAGYNTVYRLGRRSVDVKVPATWAPILNTRLTDER